MIEFPEPEPGDEIFLSPHRYNTYLECPYRAISQIRRVYQWEPTNLSQFLGSLSHRLFARDLKEEPLDTHNFTQYCREEIGRGKLNREMNELKLKPRNLETHFADLAEQHRKFQSFPIKRDQVEEVEYTLRSTPAPDVILQGRVDAVFRDESGVRIIDWKTGRLNQVENQLAFYALLWALEYEEVPKSVEGRALSGETYIAHPTVRELQELAADISGAVSELRRILAAEDEAGEMRGGNWCRYCTLLPDCPEGRVVSIVFGFATQSG